MGQEQAGITGVTLRDMSGGLNSEKFTNDIEDRDSQNCQNVYWYQGRLRKIFGDRRINTTINGVATTNDVTGIHDFQLRNGQRFKVVTLDNAIWRQNGNTWTDITGTHVVSNNKHKFITFNDNIIGVNGQDAPWSWDGVAASVTDLLVAPPGRWITSANGRVFIANAIVGGVRQRARVYFSAINSFTNWDLVDDFLEFETDDAQEITGILPLGSKIVVYKNDSIGLISGYGLSSWIVDRDFIKGVGCVSGYTLVPAQIYVNNVLTNVHLFLGENGVYAFDGTRIHIISDKITEYLKDQNRAQFSNAVGAYFSEREQYWCFLPGLGFSDNNRGFVYSTRGGGFWPITDFRAGAAASVENDDTDLEELWFGDYRGTIKRLDETSTGREQDTELVTNGTMEADANWTDLGTPTLNERSGVQFFNGTFSRRATTDAVNEGFYQDITTVVNSRYRISAVIRPVSGDVTFSKRDTDGTDIIEGLNLDSAAAGIANTWHVVTLEFTATATTSRIGFHSDLDAVSEFYVDDVSVRNIDIDAIWDSKWFDFGDPKQMKFLREISVLASQEGNFNLAVHVRYDFGDTFGTAANIALLGSGALYGTDVYGTGTYGATDLTYDDATVDQSEFRFMQLRFRNQLGGQPFEIEGLGIDVKSLGRRFLHNAT